MPTQKFLNLSCHKQKMILDTMRDALLRSPYAKITVSELIRRAGISRASFYTYFEGKDDMLSCMLRSIEGETEALLLDSFRSQKGIFSESMEQLFRLLTEHDAGRMYSQVIRHIREDEGCRPVFARVKQEYYRAEKWRSRGRDCFEVLDRSLYPRLDEDGLSCALDMGLSIIYRALLLYFERCSGLEKLEEAVEKQLGILEQGIRA